MFWLLLVSTFGALFFALFPVAVHYFGFSGEVVWSTASALLAVYLGAALVATFFVHIRMNRAGHPTSRPGGWYTLVPLGVLVVLALLLNAVGVMFHRSSGVYYTGLLFLLFSGSMMFVFMLIFSPGNRET
jgi:hypothetical protein